MTVLSFALALLLAQAGAPSAKAPAAKAAAPAIAKSATQGPKPGATAEIRNAKGETIGVASFFEAPTGVLMRVEAKGLTPGWHGVHLHEKGACAAPGFESAGAHVNPSKKPHGLLHPQGPDAGDLPNLFANQAGVARDSAFTTAVSLKGAGGRTALLDADGSAIVIHAGPDDQTTQPIGGSGARVGCGVLKAG
ncbi:MAG TPA: superoxide dismutase family protein [Caulobacteraceae bacterium]|nr:superoxide dismutase family protein [Caulobacteraceae bacterium]